MAMPIGMSDLRGIPPDKRLSVTYHHDANQHPNDITNECINSNSGLQYNEKKLLYHFELSDNSVVITNHPSLQELSSHLN